ncbi:MAG: hypothetical protein ACR2J9_12345, partial [Gaiellales bacterium]
MRMIRNSVFLFALVIAVMAAPSALATNAGDGATQQSGAGWDHATPSPGGSNPGQGGWDNTWLNPQRTVPIGVANRPYIKFLSITNRPDTTEYVIINNTGDVPRPDALNPTGPVSDVYALVAPTNSCYSGQAAADGICYNAPNRVTVSLWRDTGTGWSNDFTGATTQPNVTSDSEIHLIIGFKSAYSSLRWSWVDGIPSYWKNAVIPGVGGTVEVKFTPKTMPVMNSGG